MNVLVIDIGGSNVKLWLSSSGERRKFESGNELTPGEMVVKVLETAADWEFDVIALGLPCRVVSGRPVNNPPALGEGWVDFDYAEFHKPVRIINDAELQGLGAYRGGRMLFVGLGTLVGSVLISENAVISLDVGRLWNDKGEQIFKLLGKEGLNKLGKKKWRNEVLRTLPQLQTALLADEIVVGGGQVDLLEELPEDARRGSNADVLEGGVRLWQERPDGDTTRPAWRFL